MTTPTGCPDSHSAPEPGAAGARPAPVEARAPRRRLAATRDAISAFFGAVLGLAPHVLHHVGLLAGAALITGAVGNALLFVVGLAFSIPLLLRIHRRFRTWRAPAIAIAVFAAMFSLSAFVIGPAISGGPDPGNGPEAPTHTLTPATDPHGH